MTNNNPKWTGYFKFISPVNPTKALSDSQEIPDAGTYANNTWYQRLVQGSAARLSRYREYDMCDNDVEISRALDTIAEEMSGNNTQTDMPIDIDILTEEEKPIMSSTVLTLKAALRRWCQIHDFDNKIFPICRNMVKYGDVFFRKIKGRDTWTYIHPKNVIAALVDENDVSKVIGWQIKEGIKDAKPNISGYSSPTRHDSTEIVPASEIIRFSLNDSMSDTQPFGESVLRPVYRAFKQKELLEDAIIIYRIQRAPERRAFYIDVGKMPPQRVKRYLESIKNEIKQKRIPTMNGGQAEVDSVYNPQSTGEDFFFATRDGGRGTRVETLPGGQNLGDLADLNFFLRKLWRGLRVPASYMIEQNEGGLQWNDGKVGVAYIQELRFALFVKRMQSQVENVMDIEFKKFLKAKNILIDENMYRLKLPDPSNFGQYRQQELDSQLLSSYGNVENLSYVSPRFAMKRYLQMTDEEIITNERMRREELGLNPNGGPTDYPKLYSKREDASGGIGGMGGGSSGFMDGGFGGAPGDMTAGGTEQAPEAGTEAPSETGTSTQTEPKPTGKE